MAHPDQATALTKALVLVIGNTKSYDHVRAFMASDASLAIPTMKKRVVSGQEGDYCTPLIAACIVADLRILRYLLEQGADPNVPRSDGATPLHIAIVKRQADLSLLEELLRAGAHVNSTDQHGGTPLHSAVRRKSLDHVRRLVESGAHVDAAEVDPTTTPLLIAAFSHQVETASYLLAKGADPNKAQNDAAGTTPLTAAALHGDPAMVQLLLDSGADPRFVCSQGSTPLAYACDAPAMGANAQDTLAVARILLDRDVPINHASHDGSTALYLAAMHKQGELVQELIARGADVHAKLNGTRLMVPEGVTPLQIAAQKGCLVSVRALLAAGANVNAMDGEGTTPLIAACRNGFNDQGAYLPLIEALLDAGASATHENERGETPDRLARLWLSRKHPLRQRLSRG